MGAAPVVTTNSHDAEAQFIHAFIQAVSHTFGVQCNYQVVAQKAHSLKSAEDLDISICSVIGLVSSVFRGTITLALNDATFLALMSGMFGEKLETVSDELSDGAGELLNIIFGTAKTTLTNNGIAVEKAIPTVIRGPKIKFSALTANKPTIVVPFTGSAGPFHMLISLDLAGK